MTHQPPPDITALPDLLHGHGRSGPVRGQADLAGPATGSAGVPRLPGQGKAGGEALPPAFSGGHA